MKVNHIELPKSVLALDRSSRPVHLFPHLRVLEPQSKPKQVATDPRLFLLELDFMSRLRFHQKRLRQAEIRWPCCDVRKSESTDRGATFLDPNSLRLTLHYDSSSQCRKVGRAAWKRPHCATSLIPLPLKACRLNDLGLSLLRLRC